MHRNQTEEMPEPFGTRLWGEDGLRLRVEEAPGVHGRPEGGRILGVSKVPAGSLAIEAFGYPFENWTVL